MTADDGAVFVQMRDRPPGAGPFAPLLTAAGWAGAAERRWKHGWVVTPSGVLTATQARMAASRSGDEAVLGRSAALPPGLVTLLKDARAIARGARLPAALSSGPWVHKRVPFVWQRHDVFQRAGRAIASFIGCPLVMAVHAIHVDEARGWGVQRPLWGRFLREAGELRLIADADLIACVSDEVAASVKSYLPRRVDDVVVIGSGIDRAHFKRSAEAGAATRARLHIPSDAFVVGWHGSFRKFHGLDHLLRSFAIARARMPQARLLLVGHGVHRARLTELAAELGLRDALIAPGEVPYAEVPDYLSAMDVGVVLADPNDSFHYSPLKLFEYQASGLPVVASRIGAMATLINREQAVLVAPGDDGGLAEALVSVAADSSLRSTIATNAATLIDGQTWDGKLAELMKALNDRRLTRGDQ